MEVADYAIYRLDPNGNVATWNLGAERIKGYTAQDAIGKHFSIFYPADICETLPDQELLKAAGDGTLGNAAVFDRQVTRMLADPRSRALSTRFAIFSLSSFASGPHTRSARIVRYVTVKSLDSVGGRFEPVRQWSRSA